MQEFKRAEREEARRGETRKSKDGCRQEERERERTYLQGRIINSFLLKLRKKTAKERKMRSALEVEVEVVAPKKKHSPRHKASAFVVIKVTSQVNPLNSPSHIHTHRVERKRERERMVPNVVCITHSHS